MFFDSINQIEQIAQKCGTSVFIVPDTQPINIKNALVIQPNDKTTITIEQVRDVISHLATKQLSDRFIIIRPADKMTPEASNAFLKSFEEPGDKVHFALITNQPSKILPTILSRANIYIFRTDFNPKTIRENDETKKQLAKKLISARPIELISLARQMTKKKDHVRDYVLDILSLAIEMLYKTYFMNQKEVFIKKIPKFLNAYDNISKNGNIKLHLVADLC